MRPYVITTGTVFGLLVVAHVWRVVEEGPGLAREPWFGRHPSRWASFFIHLRKSG
jgi:hypothetical protein